MAKSKRIARTQSAGSGSVIAGAIAVVVLILLMSGHWLGWDLVWRSFGVSPLHPFFFDSYAVTNHAACALKGFDAYALSTCASITPFNYPPIWLWLGRLGIDESYSAWLAVLMAVLALATLVALLKDRSIGDGLLASLAIVSPSMMMAFERGNIDLLILALVGGAALVFVERQRLRTIYAFGLLGCGVILKLYPIFCVALAARVSRRTLWFAVALATASLIYFALIFEYLVLIGRNTPSVSLLSYGFKVPFLGFDRLLVEAKLSGMGLANGWIPVAILVFTLVGAVILAARWAVHRRRFCVIAENTPGTAFLFGAGIYCGSYILGANFTYRLMFLLLCLPQLLDWQKTKGDNEATASAARAFILSILLALWLNGNSIFLFVPQLIDWALFLGLISVLVLSGLRGVINDPGLVRRLSLSSWHLGG